MFRFALVTALVLSGAGCTYRAPTLTVADVRITERSDAGFVLLIGVDAENRNQVELPLRELHYTVTLGTGQTFSGVRSPEASLRRLGIQRIHFPAVIPLPPGTPPPTGIVRCEVAGDLDYITPGELAQVLFDTGVRRPSVTFKGEAAVNFSAPP